MTQTELRRGNAPAMVNRYLATIRNVLRTARASGNGWTVCQKSACWLAKWSAIDGSGVPLNSDAIAVLEAELGNHPQFFFTYRGEPIGWEVTNTVWQTALRKAEITDFRFHDLVIPGRPGIARPAPVAMS